MDQSKPLLPAIVQDAARRRVRRWDIFSEPRDSNQPTSSRRKPTSMPEPTCIVVDVQSRHVRVDLQERLRVAGSAPPIVVTTSRHEMVIQERAQQNGCAAFFG
jgi:hypothetical protein